MLTSKFLCPTTTHFGNGAVDELPKILGLLDAKRLFVLIDAALLNTPFFERVQQLLKDTAIETALFSEIEPDPSAHTVKKPTIWRRRTTPTRCLRLAVVAPWTWPKRLVF